MQLMRQRTELYGAAASCTKRDTVKSSMGLLGGASEVVGYQYFIQQEQIRHGIDCKTCTERTECA